MNHLLEIKDLSIDYGGDEPALTGINLSLGHKEILGIVGESGSGKTTLIRSIINLLSGNARIVSGTISFNGQDLRGLGKEEWRRLRGNDIAMIFQNPGSYLNPIIKIGRQFMESIGTHRKLPMVDARHKTLQTLTRMHLKNPDRIMDAYPFQLSGGMKQRVAIAMAIAMEPLLILADEPTSALDVKTQAQIIRELIALRHDFNTSIIMVTHNICCSAHMADRLMVMRQGEVVECGRTAKVLMKPQRNYTRKLLASIPNLKVAEHAASCEALSEVWSTQIKQTQSYPA